MPDGIIGVATIDIRARLTGFENQLRAGVSRELAATGSAFVTGGAIVQRDAAAMEAGLKARLAGFVKKVGLTDVARDVGRSASAIGIPLKVALPALGAVVGYESVKMAGNFQSQMNLMVSAAGEARSAIAGMSNEVLQIARDTGTSTTGLTSGLYSVEKAGYRAGDATHVLAIAAEGARAEGASLSAVVSGMTSVMASYHVPASQAVTVMNQIIAAAGESKTTMENFSNALSTVIPIASVAHIRFSEIGGAISTLTQHGTSANEATLELANTIRNLQAPSQVAQKALQQIGFSVNDVERGLSDPKVGLTGTINEIVAAITQHMGPAGLVLYNAFKKSQSATADLNTMIANMSPKLSKLSQQYIDGSISFADYRTGFREMGAASAAQGAQFLSLANVAKGFNDLIKSGQPAAQTFVAALKSMVGGSTGLNTVLQLTGHNLTGFEERTQRIAEAAQKAGDHVATWGAVQQSFNVQMSRLHQTIDTAMISLGQRMLPALGKAATATANWLQHLDDGGSIFANTQRKFGPLAGAVDTLHHAFQTLGTVWTTTILPGIKNLWVALQPLFAAMQRGAETVMHLANDALDALAAVYRDVVGPAVRWFTGLLAAHADGITHDIVVVGQFVAILGGVGLALRLYAAATIAAAGATATLAGVWTTLRVIMLALADGTLVEYMATLTRSTVVLTIAAGAQAVVMGVVKTATALWAAAQLLLNAALVSGSLGAFLAEARALATMIPIVTAATRLWTVAQAALDVALDANPIGIVIVAAAALVVAIVALVTHFHSLGAAVSDVFGTIGDVIHNVIGILGGFVDVVKGIFTLNLHDIAHGFWEIGKSILSIPIDIVKGLASALGDLVGLNSGPTRIFIDTSDVVRGTRVARDALDQIYLSIARVQNEVDSADFTNFDQTVNDSVASLTKQAKVFKDLTNAAGGTTTTIGNFSQVSKELAQQDVDRAIFGDPRTQTEQLSRIKSLTETMRQYRTPLRSVTVGQNEWSKALKDANGNQTKAIALVREAHPALKAYTSAINLMKAEQKRFDTGLKSLTSSLGLSKSEVNSWGRTFSVTSRDLADGTTSWSSFKSAIVDVRGILSSTSGPIGTLIGQIVQFQNSAQTATDKADLFKAALDALAGNTQDVRTTIANANIQVQNLGSSLKDAIGKGKGAADALFTLHGHAIKLTGAGAQLQTGMSQLKQQLEQVASATLQNGGTWADATKAYDNAVSGVLPRLQSQLHLTGGQVQTLNNFLSLTPQMKQVLLTMPGMLDNIGNTRSLVDLLANLHDKTIRITTLYGTGTIHGGTVLLPGQRVAGSADGNVFAHAFASGTEKHVAQLSRGTWRMWAEPETDGEAYIPLGMSKRRRSSEILATVAKMFGGAFVPHVVSLASGGITTKVKDGKTVYLYGGTSYTSRKDAQDALNSDKRSSVSGLIGSIGQSYSSPISVVDVGITRIRNQIAAAKKALHDAVAEGLDPSIANGLAAQVEKLTKLAHEQLDQLHVHIVDSDAGKLVDAIKGTAQDIRDAISQMLSDLTKAGAGKGLLDDVARAEGKIVAMQHKRYDVVQRLTSAQTALTNVTQRYNEVFSSVHDAIGSSLDIVGAGNYSGYATVSTIISSLTAQAADATKFSADIKSLTKLGLDPHLVDKLAAAGPAALSQVEALTKATPAQVAQINKLRDVTLAAAKAAGTTAAKGMYGAGVKAAQGLVDGLKSQQAALTKAMHHLADELVRELEKKLDVHSPSRRTRLVGMMTGLGVALGVTDSLEHVTRAARRLGDAALPPVAAAGGSRGRYAQSVVVNNYVTASRGMNVTQLAHRVSATQARRIRNNTLLPTAG